ncbi:hypothetical protein niasHT_009466 [Heterodera trifolii]|uniref:Protein SYS1 n=1 Tax=Heterodera trifolii TaxID=157864 RepID=A0ABD2MFJ3_9BILA
MAVGSFRTSVWDPSMILCQIVCLQSAFYSLEGSLMFSWSLFTSFRPLLMHFFFSRAQHPMVIIQLMASALCALLFPHVVVRSRLCLDFTVTLHFVHFLIVCLSNRSFPSQFSWWLLQVLSASFCTILAEWFCSRREYAEIPLAQNQANISRAIDT